MIADLDKTLKEILAQEVKILNHQSIRFEAPLENNTDEPPPPAINLFLYDIRENVQLRSNDWSQLQYTAGMEKIIPDPVRVECSYLITARGGDIESEHILLGEIISVLFRYPVIPEKFLQGELKGQLPLPVVALQAGRLQSMSEFWQALGGTPKAALHYTVTISIDPFKHDIREEPKRVEEKIIKIKNKHDSKT